MRILGQVSIAIVNQHKFFLPVLWAGGLTARQKAGLAHTLRRVIRAVSFYSTFT